MPMLAKPAAIDMTLEIVQTGRAKDFQHPGGRVAKRELGLRKASGGMMSARRVKTDAKCSIDELASDPAAWFTVLYLREGTITLRVGDRTVTLRQHDAISQAPLSVANVIEFSERLEFFELQAHDDPRVRDLMPTKPQPVIALDSPEAHTIGVGPRSFFDYRDLGVAESTGHCIELQVIRAKKPRHGGTGWHSHTMAQVSYGLSGWSSLGVAGVPKPVIQEPGDAFCIPANWVHNADAISADFCGLQVQLPAQYDTVVREVPAYSVP
jgi:quercetin dioxygenase-like cupin family protein